MTLARDPHVRRLNRRSCAARILDRGLTLRYRPRNWPVMVGLPGAAKDHLPAHALLISRGVGRSAGPGEECRAAGPPARERGTAPSHRAGAVPAPRSSLARRASAADTAPPLDRGLSRETRDPAGLAPQTDRQEVRHEQAPQAWPAADSPAASPALPFAWPRRTRCGDIAGSTASCPSSALASRRPPSHYNTARPHQGIAQHIPGRLHDMPRITVTDLDTHRIRRKPILSGLINEYIRAA